MDVGAVPTTSTKSFTQNTFWCVLYGGDIGSTSCIKTRGVYRVIALLIKLINAKAFKPEVTVPVSTFADAELVAA